MRPTQKTIALFVVALLLVGLNLLDRGSGERTTEALPAISAMVREEVARIEISTAIEKIVLVRKTGPGESGALDGAGRWHLIAPIEAVADQVAVRTLLNNFRKDVPIDVKVDKDNLEDYGLDAGNGIVVELFGAGSTPTISFTVGTDAPGGSSFVRLSGDDAVYRARVGSRHRYDRPASEWRNQVLLDFPGQSAVRLHVQKADGSGYTAQRSPTGSNDEKGNPLMGPWSFDPDPGYPADQTVLDALVDGLGRLRAGDTLGADFDGGWSPPGGTVEVALADGSVRTMTVGTRSLEGAAFVRGGGSPLVYRVARAPLDTLMSDQAELRDKTIFAFSRTQVDTLTLEEGGSTVILQQDLSNNLWKVIQPPNVDVDIRLVFYAVNTMATLRAVDVSELSPSDVGLDDSGAHKAALRITARFLDGQSMGLLVGDKTKNERGKDLWYVRRDDSQQVFLLSEDTVSKLKQGFGRS
jgi:hypothetical protein